MRPPTSGRHRTNIKNNVILLSAALLFSKFIIINAGDYTYYPSTTTKHRPFFWRRKPHNQWTPENFSTLYPDSCFTIGGLDDNDVEDIIQNVICRSNSSNDTNENCTMSDNRMIRTVATLRARAKNRIQLASSLLEKSCRDVSHACHIAVDSAGTHSLAGKVLMDCRTLQNTRDLQKTHLGKGYRTCLAFLKTKSRSDDTARSSSSSSTVIAERRPSIKHNPNSPLREDECNDLIDRADLLLENVASALEDDALWQRIIEKDGVTVWRTDVDIKNYRNAARSADDDEDEPVIIRSEAILHAPPSAVYDLFSDDSRVHEYNDNCRELEDVLSLTNNAKINWSATGKFGPFSKRDFVTLVTFKELGPQQGYVSLAVNVEHPTLVPVKRGYVRSQIQLAATFMHPVEGRPDLTRFVQVTQVGQLGGVADSALAKKISKGLQERAPVDFIKKFDQVVSSGSPKRKLREDETVM